MSKEARIAMYVGIGTGVLFVLLDPKQTVIRIVMWVVGATAAVLIATDLDWVRQRNWTLSLVDGQGVSQDFSVIRFGAAVIVIGILTALLALATWPPPETKFAVQVVPSTANTGDYGNSKTVVPVVPTPTPTTPQPKRQTPTSVAKPKEGIRNRPKETPKLTTSPNYPIVTLSDNSVTYDGDNRKITIKVSIGNTTQTEANAHVELYGVGFMNDIAVTGRMNNLTRDIGLAPMPNAFAMSSEYTFPAEVKPNYDDGTAYIVLYINVSYSDRGGTTTYHFVGKTGPKNPQLDEQSSGWDGPK